MSRKKPPRIVNQQMGAMVAVSRAMLLNMTDPGVVERIVMLNLYRQGRRPTFRYRGRWPYRAFGKPRVIKSASGDWGDPLDLNRYYTVKWDRAVALWRKP